MQLPSFPLAEERVDQRSVVGVSRPGGHCRQWLSFASIHPVIAALDIPLFASRKEGVRIFRALLVQQLKHHVQKLSKTRLPQLVET